MEKAGAVAAAPVAAGTGFFKYVFAFDDEVKCQVGNMLQYAALALLPVLGILKTVQHLVPEEDPHKGSLMLAAESVGQVALVLVLMWLTDRVIRYIPTLSGCVYGEFQPVAFLLPFLIILATLQTKLGAKLSLIMERIIGDEGPGTHHSPQHPSHKQGHQAHPASHPAVRVTQPLSSGHRHSAPPSHHHSQADSLGMPKLLPDDRQLTTIPTSMHTQGVPAHVEPQKSPDFDAMYQGPTTPLQNAATPGGGGPRPGPTAEAAHASALQEPMAANEALGGSMGSMW